MSCKHDWRFDHALPGESGPRIAVQCFDCRAWGLVRDATANEINKVLHRTDSYRPQYTGAQERVELLAAAPEQHEKSKKSQPPTIKIAAIDPAIWMTGPEAAQRARLSHSTIRRLAGIGQFPACYRLNLHFVRWRRSDVESWLERKATQPLKEKTP